MFIEVSFDNWICIVIKGGRYAYRLACYVADGRTRKEKKKHAEKFYYLNFFQDLNILNDF